MRVRTAFNRMLAIPGAWVFLAALYGLNTAGLGWSAIFLPIAAVGVLVLAGFGPAAVKYLADCSEILAADRASLMSFYTVALAGGGAIGAVLGGTAIRLAEADGLLALAALLSLLTFGLLGVALRWEAPPAAV